MSRERRSMNVRVRAPRAGAASLATLLALVLALPAPAGAQERTAGVEPEVRGWIGIGLRSTVTCEAGAPGEWPRDGSDCERAVLCETVVVDGPADRAGVQPGDVLLEIDGRPVLDQRGKFDLPAFAPGETITLTLRRDGRRTQVQVEPAERPERPEVRPVKVLREGAFEWPSPPGAPESNRAGEKEYVVRLAPVASAPQPPTVHVRSGEGGSYVVQGISGEDMDSIMAAARAGTVSGWPGAEAFVSSKARRAYDSALAEIRPVLDSLRKVQAGQLREMVEATQEAQRAAVRDERERVAQLREQVGQLRDRQREVAEEAREIREAAEGIAEMRAAREVTGASRIVRLAGGEFLTLSPGLAESFEGVDGGLLVTRVLAGFPAEQLGLREGDVVVEAGGETVTAPADFRRALFQLAREGSLEVTWVRKGTTMSGTLPR